MMTTRARIVLITYGVFVSMLFCSLGLEQFRHIGRAEAQPLSVGSADPPSLIIDAGVVPLVGSGSASMSAAPNAPTELARQGGETQWNMVSDYGPIWGGMLLLYGIGAAFVKRHPNHWLSRGHMLTGGVGAVGLLGALLEANFASGTSGAGIPVTMLMAVKLLLQKPHGPPQPPAPPAP